MEAAAPGTACTKKMKRGEGGGDGAAGAVDSMPQSITATIHVAQTTQWLI